MEIISLEEKRDLRNIALDKETLSTHSGRKKELTNNETAKYNGNQISKNSGNIKRKTTKGVTKAEYEENLEKNIEQLVEELQNMKYKPSPAKRVYIPKANGKVRGLAITTYEDKLVQMAVKKIVEAIYEPKFLNTMYGFRPKQNCHNALKELSWTIERK